MATAWVHQSLIALAILVLGSLALGLQNVADHPAGHSAKRVAILRGPTGVTLQFSPDGSRLLSQSETETVLWNTGDYTRIPLIGQKAGAATAASQFSSDSTHLLAPTGGRVGVWESKTGRLISTLQHDNVVCSAAFLPRSIHVLTAAMDEKLVRRWDSMTGNVVGTIRCSGAVRHVQPTPDGSKLLTVVSEGTGPADLSFRLYVHDLNTGRVLTSRQIDYERVEVSGKEFGRDVAVSSDSSMAATRNFRHVTVWKILTGQAVTFMDTLDVGHGTSGIAFTSDGRRLLTADGHEAHLWDARSGALLGRLDASSFDVVLSAKRPLAATMGDVGGTHLWDLGTNGVIFAVKPKNNFEAGVAVVAFSSDGSTMAVGYPQDEEVTIVEVSQTRDDRRR